MANSYRKLTVWVSVSHLLKSEHICTSYKPRASQGQAVKVGRFDDAFNMENALMQQPSHILPIGLGAFSVIAKL